MSFTTTPPLLTHVGGGNSIGTIRGVSFACPKKSLKLSSSSFLSHYHKQQQAFSSKGGIRYHHYSNYTTFRVKCSQPHDVGNVDASSCGETPNQGDSISDKSLADLEIETGSSRSSLLAKLAIALGVAATVTLILVGLKWPMQGSSLGVPFGSDASSALAPSVPLVGFSLKVFGYQFTLPQYAPGIIFKEFPYIISTVMWIYWGVCISDMVSFYIGRLFRQSGASDDVYSKLGIGKEKAASVTQAMQQYGNLIGFVERFSVGVRNPTSFLAGDICRVLLCWRLLWWFIYTPNSVGNRILATRAPRGDPR